MLLRTAGGRPRSAHLKKLRRGSAPPRGRRIRHEGVTSATRATGPQGSHGGARHGGWRSSRRGLPPAPAAPPAAPAAGVLPFLPLASARPNADAGVEVLAARARAVRITPRPQLLLPALISAAPWVTSTTTLTFTSITSRGPNTRVRGRESHPPLPYNRHEGARTDPWSTAASASFRERERESE